MADNILTIMTTRGIQMITNSIAGDEVTFTRLGFGDGDMPQNPESRTSLVHECLSSNITDFSRQSNYVRIKTVFDSTDVASTFNLKEIGVFGTSTAYPTEQLIAYIYQSDLTETVLGDSDNKFLENEFAVQIIIDASAQVTANIESLVYVSESEFNAHALDYNNPHGVTAAQIGTQRVKTITATLGASNWNTVIISPDITVYDNLISFGARPTPYSSDSPQAIVSLAPPLTANAGVYINGEDDAWACVFDATITMVNSNCNVTVRASKKPSIDLNVVATIIGW